MAASPPPECAPLHRFPQARPRSTCSGATIAPGLWDMHAHAAQIEWLPAYLAAGVTTIRDMGGEQPFLTAMRDTVANGKGLGPRVLLAGLVDGDAPAGFGATVASTPDQGRAVVDRYKAAGFNQIKLYSLLQPDVVAAINSARPRTRNVSDRPRANCARPHHGRRGRHGSRGALADQRRSAIAANPRHHRAAGQAQDGDRSDVAVERVARARARRRGSKASSLASRMPRRPCSRTTAA